jgi:hypothetical protein
MIVLYGIGSSAARSAPRAKGKTMTSESTACGVVSAAVGRTTVLRCRTSTEPRKQQLPCPARILIFAWQCASSVTVRDRRQARAVHPRCLRELREQPRSMSMRRQSEGSNAQTISERRSSAASRGFGGGTWCRGAGHASCPMQRNAVESASPRQSKSRLRLDFAVAF